VQRVLRKLLYLKAYKLSVVEDVERLIVCTPLSINVFVTLATQYHLEYHCKALIETPYIGYKLSKAKRPRTVILIISFHSPLTPPECVTFTVPVMTLEIMTILSEHIRSD
jgi:hypothetical protein